MQMCIVFISPSLVNIISVYDVQEMYLDYENITSIVF